MRRYVPVGWRVNKYRWLEMIDVCRQYQQTKQDITNIRLEYKASMSGSIAVQQSGNGSPVERKFERMDKQQSRIDLIESTCREATADMPAVYDFLMFNITEGIPYKNMCVPCDKNQFTALRQYFFYLLNERL